MTSLTRLTLHLGRNPEAGFPDGDDRHGYLITAPLDRDGRLDVDLWGAHKDACIAIRFSPDKSEFADGWLSHRGANWFFRYDEEHEGPDEPLFRLGDHQLRVGDYVTIHEADGDDLVYRIVKAEPVRV